MKKFVFVTLVLGSLSLLSCTDKSKETGELTALDKIEIMETSAMLDNSLDKENLTGFLSVFTTKGVFEIGGKKFTGPAEIEASFHYMLSTFARGKRHCVSNEIISGNQKEARMESYLSVINRDDLARSGSAIQHDVMIKQNGKWKILNRRIDIDPSIAKGQK